MFQIEDKIEEIGNKIQIISKALEDMIEDGVEDEITKTEYDIIQSVDNIEYGFKQLVDNYNNFKKDGDSEEVEDVFNLACNMLNSSLEETARLLEISI